MSKKNESSVRIFHANSLSLGEIAEDMDLIALKHKKERTEATLQALAYIYLTSVEGLTIAKLNSFLPPEFHYSNFEELREVGATVKKISQLVREDGFLNAFYVEKLGVWNPDFWKGLVFSGAISKINRPNSFRMPAPNAHRVLLDEMTRDDLPFAMKHAQINGGTVGFWGVRLSTCGVVDKDNPYSIFTLAGLIAGGRLVNKEYIRSFLPSESLKWEKSVLEERGRIKGILLRVAERGDLELIRSLFAFVDYVRPYKGDVIRRFEVVFKKKQRKTVGSQIRRNFVIPNEYQDILKEIPSCDYPLLVKEFSGLEGFVGELGYELSSESLVKLVDLLDFSYSSFQRRTVESGVFHFNKDYAIHMFKYFVSNSFKHLDSIWGRHALLREMQSATGMSDKSWLGVSWNVDSEFILDKYLIPYEKLGVLGNGTLLFSPFWGSVLSDLMPSGFDFWFELLKVYACSPLLPLSFLAHIYKNHMSRYMNCVRGGDFRKGAFKNKVDIFPPFLIQAGFEMYGMRSLHPEVVRVWKSKDSVLAVDLENFHKPRGYSFEEGHKQFVKGVMQSAGLVDVYEEAEGAGGEEE